MNTASRGGRAHGFSLIELMVAMVLGLLVAAGIITVFLSTSSSNRAQNQLAQLQEEGRFAITRLVGDLRMANGQYCSNTGGTATQGGSGVFMDGLRAPRIYATDIENALSDLTTAWGAAPYPAKPAESYYLPAYFSMRGYDCDKSSCAPNVPASLPAPGKAVGSRVVGTSVLTLRYLDAGAGWSLEGNSIVVPGAGGLVDHVTVVPAAGEPAIADHYAAPDLLMLADCSNASVFAASLQGNAFYPQDAGAGNYSRPKAQQPQSAPRLFNFSRDYKTVTWYLQVVDNGSGGTTGALMRRENGNAEEVVRGVERLDFLYGIEDGNGNTRYLGASDVDTRANGDIPCSPSWQAPLGGDVGCLWRGIKSIEVRLLMDGQQDLASLGMAERNYTYAGDGITTPEAPGAAGRKVTPAEQGFADTMLRREFSALVSVRNYNP
ncbi:PilW family protein [Rhodanobacter sp. Si-c]|uniref:PilW family protein n=1 Tax=Rhodanobacter lycopersici TaxID=3162487 RepID=A0ABV3QIV9_9GAMM